MIRLFCFLKTLLMVNRTVSSSFDILILTAANEAQATGYRAQLTWREQRGLLPPSTRWFVVTDPGGQRVGSGGSTLEVLRYLAEEVLTAGNTFHERFAGHRILIAHSGGDARRLPAYSALGKVFMPLPCDITPPHHPAWDHFPATVFDVLLHRLTELPPSPEGEVLLCSGDVLLTFNARETNLATPAGVTGLGFAVPPVIGRQHGVYVTETPSIGGAVVRFLQKPSLETMEAQRAVDLTGRVLVDTGVLNFSPLAVESLLESAGLTLQSGELLLQDGLHHALLQGEVGEVDLYREIIPALPMGMELQTYLEQAQVERRVASARSVLTTFYQRLRDYHLPFNVTAVPDGEFFHIGTTRDLLSKLPVPSRTGRDLQFENGHRTRVDGGSLSSLSAEDATSANLFAFNTVLPVQLRAAELSYVEGCDLGKIETPVLQGSNLLVGLSKESLHGLQSLELPQSVGLVSFPVLSCNEQGNADTQQVDVPVLFGLDDDNKTSIGQDGLFLNLPLQQFVEAGLSAKVLWAGESEQSSWTAKLWMRGDAGWRVVETLLLLRRAMMMDAPAECQAAVQELARLWQAGPRYSLAQIVTKVSHEELLRRRHDLAGQATQVNLLGLLLEHEDLPIAHLLQRAGEPVVLPEVAAQWITALREQMARASIKGLNWPPLIQARLHRAIAVLAEVASSGDETSVRNRVVSKVEVADSSVKPAHDEQGETFKELARIHQNLALDAVAQTIESAVELPHDPRPAAILHDQAVWVTAPARIDFAGGWSDTPPICLERGGTVLNAAVTLNGQYPIQVIAKLNEDFCIRLTSIDLGQQEIYRTAEEINGPIDLTHWSSLAKAALVLSGIVPDQVPHRRVNQKNHSLRDWLTVLGGGIDLTLFSGLPKGSGMGTSSILGSAVLACLARVLGRQLSHHELIAQTSLLEQRMTSGGGWQDQIGGIVAGVKLIQTEPGIEQKPQLQWSVFGGTQAASEDLQRRMLMYYSGHKRLAKNILQNVVARYLAREPEIIRVVDQLKAGAVRAKQALEANDVVTFSQCVSEYWQLKKTIDPGSTNAHIEEIMGHVQPFVSAASVCGAGGGGFMFFIARDEEAVYKIRHRLQSTLVHPGSRFFDFAVDGQGLKVSVL
jgi:fucokinase